MSHINDSLYKKIQAGALFSLMDAIPFTWQHLPPLMTGRKHGSNTQPSSLTYFIQTLMSTKKISKNSTYFCTAFHHLVTCLRMRHPLDDSTYTFSISITRPYHNFRTHPSDWSQLSHSVNDSMYLDITCMSSLFT